MKVVETSAGIQTSFLEIFVKLRRRQKDPGNEVEALQYKEVFDSHSNKFTKEFEMPEI